MLMANDFQYVELIEYVGFGDFVNFVVLDLFD